MSILKFKREHQVFFAATQLQFRLFRNTIFVKAFHTLCRMPQSFNQKKVIW
jgi:hypothetical protein